MVITIPNTGVAVAMSTRTVRSNFDEPGKFSSDPVLGLGHPDHLVCSKFGCNTRPGHVVKLTLFARSPLSGRDNSDGHTSDDLSKSETAPLRRLAAPIGARRNFAETT